MGGLMFAAIQRLLRELLPHESAVGIDRLHEVSGLDEATIESELERLALTEPRVTGSSTLGYRYVPGEWRFSPEIFHAALNTRWWGRRACGHDSLPSTMEAVREQANASVPEGTLVVAEHQTSGRGRRGNTWMDAGGQDILCSFLLRSRDQERIPAGGVAIMTALAVAETLNKTHTIPAKVVWPNDLYVGHKKIGGVLVEGPVDGDGWVVGLGLNVNSGPRDWLAATSSDPLHRPRTSLKTLKDGPWDRSVLLAQLGLDLETLWEAMRSEPQAALQAAWNRHSALIGQRIGLDFAGERLEGTVLGMDEQARLRIQTHDGVHSLDLNRASRLERI